MKSIKKEITPSKMAVIVILIFVLFIYSAQITGHWAGSVKDQEFRMRLRSIDSQDYTHPGSAVIGKQ